MSKTTLYLCIVCAINGFRRAGVRHSSKPTYYEEDFFTEEQRRQLDGEPRITVVELTEVPDGVFIHGAAIGQPRQPVADLSSDADGSANGVGSSTADAGGAPNQVDQAAAPAPDSADAPAAGNQVDVVTKTDQIKPLASLTVKELRQRAQDAGIEQFSSMTKADLVEALQAVLGATGADTIPTGAAE